MSSINYYQKYLKYKQKYLDLQNDIRHNKTILTGGANCGFFFMHGTKNFDNLLSILDDEYIFLGKDVDEKYRFLSGSETESDEIYMSIYFKDIDNIKHFLGITLILDCKLIYDRDLVFQEGWYGSNPIYFSKNDNKKTFNAKFKHMHDFLENPITVPQKIREFSGLMDHQVLTSEPIPLKKYLRGIALNIQENDDTYKRDLKKIKNKIKQKNYDVKIYYASTPKNINL